MLLNMFLFYVFIQIMLWSVLFHIAARCQGVPLEPTSLFYSPGVTKVDQIASVAVLYLLVTNGAERAQVQSVVERDVGLYLYARCKGDL